MGTDEVLDDPICVWVVNDPNLLMHRSDQGRHLEIFVPPASDNQTLQAQEGLFVWQRRPIGATVHVQDEYREFHPIEEILSASKPGCLTKLLLDTRYPLLVMHKLIKLGYDGSRLFPGFRGSAEAVREHVWAGVPTLLG